MKNRTIEPSCPFISLVWEVYMSASYLPCFRRAEVLGLMCRVLLKVQISFSWMTTRRRSQDSSVNTETRLQARRLGFISRQEQWRDSFPTASRPALGPTQLPVYWVPGSISLGTKRPKREVKHSPPSSAEDKNAWSYTSTPPLRLHDRVLN
jgi:hypothetical protein